MLPFRLVFCLCSSLSVPHPPIPPTPHTGVLSLCLYSNTVRQTAKVSRRAKIGPNKCTHTHRCMRARHGRRWYPSMTATPMPSPACASAGTPNGSPRCPRTARSSFTPKPRSNCVSACVVWWGWSWVAALCRVGPETGLSLQRGGTFKGDGIECRLSVAFRRAAEWAGDGAESRLSVVTPRRISRSETVAAGGMDADDLVAPMQR